MGGWDWSEDSRLLFARARHHQVEFNRLLSNDETDRLWSVEEKANKDGTYSYALLVDPSKLEQTKPVAADVANNLVHALDQLVAGSVVRHSLALRPTRRMLAHPPF